MVVKVGRRAGGEWQQKNERVVRQHSSRMAMPRMRPVRAGRQTGCQQEENPVRKRSHAAVRYRLERRQSSSTTDSSGDVYIPLRQHALLPPQRSPRVMEFVSQSLDDTAARHDAVYGRQLSPWNTRSSLACRFIVIRQVALVSRANARDAMILLPYIYRRFATIGASVHVIHHV